MGVGKRIMTSNRHFKKLGYFFFCLILWAAFDCPVTKSRGCFPGRPRQTQIIPYHQGRYILFSFDDRALLWLELMPDRGLYPVPSPCFSWAITILALRELNNAILMVETPQLMTFYSLNLAFLFRYRCSDVQAVYEILFGECWMCSAA